jgi:hypothetical protein
MKQNKITAALFSVLLGAALAGCDETLSEKKSTDVKSDGTTVTKTETVKEKADDTVVKEKTKEVDRPGDANDEKTVKKEEVKE